MTSTEIRPDVVSLFLDIDWTTSAIGPDKPPKLVHRDGQQFTEAEHALFMSMTTAELQAAQRYAETVQEHAESKARDLSRMRELIRPYAAQLGKSATVASLRAIMTPEDRAECDEIADRIAPDGYLP